MKRKYSVFSYGEEFICSYMFDTDNGDGVDIKRASSDEHIGELWGYHIPDSDDEDDDPTTFIKAVENYLERNYW